MFELLPLFKQLLAILLWIVLCYVAPREFMRRSISQEYRECVRTRAYWGRAHDKWIIGNRVFYTDDFWDDIFLCLLTGLLLNFSYMVLVTQIATRIVDDLETYLAAAISVPIFLFFMRQHDRIQVPNEEMDRRQSIDPSFSGESEMNRLLYGDRKFIRRIIGRHAKARTRAGE